MTTMTTTNSFPRIPRERKMVSSDCHCLSSSMMLRMLHWEPRVDGHQGCSLLVAHVMRQSAWQAQRHAFGIRPVHTCTSRACSRQGRARWQVNLIKELISLFVDVYDSSKRLIAVVDSGIESHEPGSPQYKNREQAIILYTEGSDENITVSN